MSDSSCHHFCCICNHFSFSVSTSKRPWLMSLTYFPYYSIIFSGFVCCLSSSISLICFFIHDCFFFLHVWFALLPNSWYISFFFKFIFNLAVFLSYYSLTFSIESFFPFRFCFSIDCFFCCFLNMFCILFSVSSIEYLVVTDVFLFAVYYL